MMHNQFWLTAKNFLRKTSFKTQNLGLGQKKKNVALPEINKWTHNQIFDMPLCHPLGAPGVSPEWGYNYKSNICGPVLLKFSQRLHFWRLATDFESNAKICPPAPLRGPRGDLQGGHRAKYFICSLILLQFSQGLHIWKLLTYFEPNLEKCIPAPIRGSGVPTGGRGTMHQN